MKLTAGLAYSQLKANRSRAFWTLAGIALSTAMITAVSGFAVSADTMFKGLVGESRYYNSMYDEMLWGLGAVFGSVIMAASVLVMSNAFRVSAGERVKQFGILKSVGATKGQIARIVVWEGLYLAAVAIPLGIALGLLVNYIGVQIMDSLLAAANKRNTFQINFDFVVAWQAILASTMLSLGTVWLSAWLPARRAARIAAIDAIRGAGEVNLEAKSVRGGRLIGKLFGFEGTLAYKSLKRNRRSFRASALSLTVSVLLFIVAGEFGAQYQDTAKLYYPGVDANVVSSFIPFKEAAAGGEGTGQRVLTVDTALAEEITGKMLEYPNTAVFGVGDDSGSYSAVVPKELLTSGAAEYLSSGEYAQDESGYSLPVTLYTLDAKNYAALCRRAGVPLGSNILINYLRIPGDEGKTVMAPYAFSSQALRVTNKQDRSEWELKLDGVLQLRDVPNEIATVYLGNVMIIVPQLDATRYFWFASAPETREFAAHADKALRESISMESVNITQNVEETLYAKRDIERLIMVFVYGFVTMLTLIGLTNVISTLSANVRSRAGEFAVLRSVGITPSGLSRMLNLESIFCSVRSLLFGVPLGILVSYVRYRSFASPVALEYQLPWVQIVECALGVMAVTWITMRYSLSRLRGGNIVETIRSGS